MSTSPVDAFFLQIQGSGRVTLDDGTSVRAAYAGQNGHPYTAIGAVLIQMGALTRENVSMQSIRAWLAAHPAEMNNLLDRNASYVFFSVQPLGIRLGRYRRRRRTAHTRRQSCRGQWHSSLWRWGQQLNHFSTGRGNLQDHGIHLQLVVQAL